MHSNLVADVNNITSTLCHAKLKKVTSAAKKERFAKETLFIETVHLILRHSKMLKTNAIVLCIDSKNVWRRGIYPEYKANHSDDIENFYYQDVIDAIEMVADFFRTYTSAIVLKHPHMEADDLIAIWCQESDVNNVILSSDKDFIQLINDRTTLYSHTQNKFRETEDAAFDLFVKCIRGDRGDNIRSAYPRVQETALKRAWEDKLTMLNLLETVRPDGVIVKDALMFNVSLIDLSEQPSDLRASAVNMMNTQEKVPYKYLSALKFMADNNLKNISQSVLEYHDRVLGTKPVLRNT